VGLQVPALPDQQPDQSHGPVPAGIFEKSYLSIYATLSQRAAIIKDMESALRKRLYPNTTVTQIANRGLDYELSVVQPAAQKRVLAANSLLLASGRFGPLLIHQNSWLPKAFRRLEIGIRLEQPTSSFFLVDHPQVDPKYIFSDDTEPVEYRTFCCCRDGEIVALEHDGICAISGRADVVASGRSNVGFHVRILDAAVSLRIWQPLLDRLRRSPAPSRMSMLDLLNAEDPENTPIGRQLGPDVLLLIMKGLRRLIAHRGESSFAGAVIHAPALEGFVDYPAVDNNLRIHGTRIWAAGDVNGQFRGLVAALVSGYFAGLQIARMMREVT
jgi:hypothetical protein